MKNLSITGINMKHMQSFMESGFPGESYQIFEYETFYTAVFTGEHKKHSEPILFNKNGAFPIPKNYASMSLEERKNPKLIYTYGGKDNGKERFLF